MLALCGIEVILITAATVIAFLLRFDPRVAAQYLSQFWWMVPLSVVVRIALFWIFGLYSWVWYYMGIREVLYLVLVIAGSSVVLSGIGLMVSRFALPETLLIVEWLVVMALIGGERLFIRVWREYQLKQELLTKREERKRLLIVGAGDATELIRADIYNHPALGYQLVGYIDDDERKLGHKIRGIRVLGTTQDIPLLGSQYNIDEILISIPSASGEAMRRIVAVCQESRVPFRTLPSMHELINGRVTVNRIREVQIEDLLRRETYEPDLGQMASYLRGSRVLVTGAAGSIGSELCHQVAGFDPDLLILFDINETGLYEVELDIRQQFPDLRMEVAVGDIKMKSKAELMMQLYGPDIVFHAAAHKHVPVMEFNPDEAVFNNILGTKVWIDAADHYGVKRFVFISTDKAVNPTSVMGAAKKVAGMLLQCKSQESRTKFMAVRFGNVLGTRGSVVPLFKKQIAEGGPITVTHPEIVRYFMTADEAVRLILQAAALGNGGEIFVLDMGQPVKILDLARDMIKLSGLEEGEDIEIKFIGLRPGEKLYEETLTETEELTATRHEKIFLARLESISKSELDQGIDDLEELALRGNSAGIKLRLKELVPSYQPVVVA